VAALLPGMVGEQIRQVFGTKPPAGVPPAHQGNYMAYRGGQLHFGKLTMAETDLVLIDLDPEDPFDLCLDHYNRSFLPILNKG
jgi:hypothetical protein